MINRGQGIRGGFKSFLTVVSSSIIVHIHADTSTRDISRQTQLVRQIFLLDFVPPRGSSRDKWKPLSTPLHSNRMSRCSQRP